MKYKEWLWVWLNDYQKNYLKPRTFRNYEGVARNHILPKLGEYELNELSLSVLQSFVVDRETNGRGIHKTGLASGTMKIIVNVLQKSLDMAVEIGEVEYHNANRIKMQKSSSSKEVECFSMAEQKIIENAILNKFPNKKIGILISLYTGLRVGEIVALRWEDVDFQNFTITVNHTAREIYIDGKRETVLDEPKTISSKRVIPIPKRLIPYMLITKSAYNCEYVVMCKNRSTTIRAYQKLYKRMLERENIKYRSFHTLRHTFATRALECGMDVKTLSEIMGHKTPTITLNRYSHSLTEHKIAMMNRLGENLDR